MRLLVVHCHPVADSFGAALRDRVVGAARAGGHDVRLVDLYADGFDPVMGADERGRYHDPGVNEAPVARELADLRWAEGLVLVYPTWWYSQPAMLKGWLDRVWLPHVAFTVPTETAGIRPGMTNIRLLGVVTTLGCPRWLWWMMGQPGRRILLRGVRACCAPRCRTFWLGLHEMDTAPAEARSRFLDRVARRISRLEAQA